MSTIHFVDSFFSLRQPSNPQLLAHGASYVPTLCEIKRQTQSNRTATPTPALISLVRCAVRRISIIQSSYRQCNPPVTVTYGYNAFDQITDKQYSDSTPAVHNTYNKSRLTLVQAGSWSYNYTAFDAIGRVKDAAQSRENGSTYGFHVTYKPVIGANGSFGNSRCNCERSAGNQGRRWNYNVVVR